MNFLNLIPISAVILTNIIGCNIIYSYYVNRREITKKYNYLLFYITFFSSLSWLVYGIITNDIYVLSSTFCSLFGSYMFIQVLHKEINDKYLWMIELFCLIFYIYFIGLTFGLTFSQTFVKSVSANKQIINQLKQIHFIVSMSLSIATNFSPMLILYEVIKTSNCELIYLPQALIGLINLSLWLVYALFINDIYQIITDIVSLAMCLIQLCVYFYYSCFTAKLTAKSNKVKPIDSQLNVKSNNLLNVEKNTDIEKLDNVFF